MRTQRPCAYQCGFSAMSILIFSDDAKKAVLFVGNSSGEINSVAEREHVPQAIKLKRSSVGSIDRSEESAGGRIVIIDLAIAKVADPKLVAFDQGESPRRIQMAMRNQAPNEVATGVEDEIGRAHV